MVGLDGVSEPRGLVASSYTLSPRTLAVQKSGAFRRVVGGVESGGGAVVGWKLGVGG